MNFEERARKARDRGQQVRAAVLLIEGLKRDPAQRNALDFLVDIYLCDLESAGLEYDLTTVVAAQADAEELFTELLQELDARQKSSMGRELVRAARESGYRFEWPPPQPEPEPEPEPQPEPESEPQPEPDAAEASEATQLRSDGPGSEVGVAQAEPSTVRADAETSPAPVSEPKPSVEAAPPDTTSDPQRDETSSPPETTSQEPAADERASSSGPAKKRAGRKKFAWLLAAVVLLGAAGGFMWWSSQEAVQDLETLDAAIAVLDAGDREAITAEFPEPRAGKQRRTEVAERRSFLLAVHAVDRGGRSAPVDSTQTRWGLAAAAAVAALERDFEQALAHVTRLERAHPDALATHWAAGYVAEARGRYANAVRHYQAGSKAYPRFAALSTGMLRVHTRQGRADAAARVAQKLQELHPNNPYAAMPLEFPTLQNLDEPPSDDTTFAADDAQPAFVRAVVRVAAAAESLRRRELDEAAASLDAALEQEPRLAGGLLVAGIVHAQRLEVQRASETFAKLVQIPGLSDAYRWGVQVAAPNSLLAAGRADLAFRFVPPVSSVGKVVGEEAKAAKSLPEPAVPFLSVEQRVSDDPLARRAVLARAEVLSQLGLFGAAEETLSLLRGHADIAVARGSAQALLEIRRGNRRRARAATRAIQDERGRSAARASVAYHRGRYAKAIEYARRARSDEAATANTTMLRYLTLSLSALGRGRQALAVLDKARVSVLELAEREALRMRVVGRGGSSDAGGASSYERVAQVEPTAIERLIDLGAVAFWQKKFDDADGWLDSALQRAPDHPEANWYRGLLQEVGGASADEHDYFRSAWRDDSDDPGLLLELGRIHLGLDKPRRAQKFFYRALLRDRTSLEAIEGLGRAYLGYSRKLGKRDLARILGGYRGSSRYKAQAAEALRWLAVLHGSRRGDAEGLNYLERAVDIIGEAPSILVEKARYHEALDAASTARKFYAKALEKNTTLAPARLGLARMALKAGEQGVARTHLQRYLTVAPNGEHASWARDKLAELSPTAQEGEE